VSISVTASASTITVGGRTNLTVHLGGWGAGKPVKLYATPYGGTKTLVASGVANAFGNYVRAVAPARRTTYTAEWEGDAAHAPDTATKLIYVRARVAIAQAGFYGSSGSYRLYHFHSSCWTAGTYCPRFAATVYPNHAGAAVRFVLQRRTSSGAWANATSGSATADSRSIAHAFFRYGGTGWIGQTLRVRASWAGNVQNLAAASGWSYFRITR